jgi:hypothetical protein
MLLTTREHILNQAKLTYEKIRSLQVRCWDLRDRSVEIYKIDPSPNPV